MESGTMKFEKPEKKQESKSTPGKWDFVPTGKVMQGYQQPYGIVQHGTANIIAGVFGDVIGGLETAKANAIMLARAPELEERNRELLEALEPFRKLAEAVIVEAEIDINERGMNRPLYAYNFAEIKYSDLKRVLDLKHRSL